MKIDPSVIHVKLPNASGDGFVLDNLLVALFFIFAMSLVGGRGGISTAKRWIRKNSPSSKSNVVRLTRPDA